MSARARKRDLEARFWSGSKTRLTKTSNTLVLRDKLRILESRHWSKPIVDRLPNVTPYLVYAHQIRPTEPTSSDLNLLRPKLGWAPLTVIQKTLAATTQYAKQVIRTSGMRQHFKTRFPALNVHRRNEAVSTDTVFSDTPAIITGARCAQLFVGHKSLLADVYPMKTDRQFVNALEDNIRARGAMDMLISDRAQAEISSKIKDILRAYRIKDWQSEPMHQHQNPCETRYRTIKEYTNNIMNKTGTPASCWFLCLEYVCYLLNHLSSEVLDWRTPLEVALGSTPDISALLHYQFYEPVY